MNGKPLCRICSGKFAIDALDAPDLFEDVLDGELRRRLLYHAWRIHRAKKLCQRFGVSFDVVPSEWVDEFEEKTRKG